MQQLAPGWKHVITEERNDDACRAILREHESTLSRKAMTMLDGMFALAFISNEDQPTDVACDAAYFAQMNATGMYKVRDVWGKADAGTASAPFSLTAKGLIPHGGVAMYTFTPVAATAV